MDPLMFEPYDLHYGYGFDNPIRAAIFCFGLIPLVIFCSTSLVVHLVWSPMKQKNEKIIKKEEEEYQKKYTLKDAVLKTIKQPYEKVSNPKNNIIMEFVKGVCIVMSYDKDKKSFVYWCNNGVKYDTLDKLSKKYIYVYNCPELYKDDDFEDIVDECMDIVEGVEESKEREGDESEGDESEGDESGGDESGGDESGGDESEGDESGGNESEGDESEGDESEGDESEGDESEGDERQTVYFKNKYIRMGTIRDVKFLQDYEIKNEKENVSFADFAKLRRNQSF